MIVDIEGGEIGLIKNELEILENKCEILIIEFHESYVNGTEEIKNMLKSSSFVKIDKIGSVFVYQNITFV